MDDVCICTTEPRPRVLVVAPMEAGMGMSCWILMVFVIVEPVLTRSASGTIKAPVGIIYGIQTSGLCALGVLGTAARDGKGAMRVRSIPATPGRLPTFYGASESQ